MRFGEGSAVGKAYDRDDKKRLAVGGALSAAVTGGGLKRYYGDKRQMKATRAARDQSVIYRDTSAKEARKHTQNAKGFITRSQNRYWDSEPLKHFKRAYSAKAPDTEAKFNAARKDIDYILNSRASAAKQTRLAGIKDQFAAFNNKRIDALRAQEIKLGRRMPRNKYFIAAGAVPVAAAAAYNQFKHDFKPNPAPRPDRSWTPKGKPVDRQGLTAAEHKATAGGDFSAMERRAQRQTQRNKRQLLSAKEKAELDKRVAEAGGGIIDRGWDEDETYRKNRELKQLRG